MGITVNRAPDHFILQDRRVGSLLGTWANCIVQGDCSNLGHATLEAAMVSKCANPSCSGTFRYLHEGRIFHVAVGSTAQQKLAIHGIPTLERFWLCGECSRKMTVISHPAGVLIVPLQQLSEPQKQRNGSNAVGFSNELFIAACTY